MKYLLPLTFLLASPAFSQTYEHIVDESFDYAAGSLGGLNGGFGWENKWWSGAGLGDGVVVGSSYDPLGNRMQVNVDHGGSYRLIDRSSLGPILDGGQLGADNTTIWIGFMMKKETGCDHLYGGLSLNWQWVGEQLFLGSPWGTNEVGFARAGAPGHNVVSGSDDATLNTMVYRIDFLSGDDRIQFWLNPPTDHPTTASDLDVMVADFRFNEIRLQSGDGTVTGFSFDGIAIDTPAFRPIYTVTNATVGSIADFEVSNVAPGNKVIIGYSLSGGGPTSTTFGDVGMSPPISQLPKLVADPTGVASFSASVPLSLGGATVYTQAVELLGGGAGNLSNPLVVNIP